MDLITNTRGRVCQEENSTGREPLLRLAVSISYGDHQVLRGAQLEVGRGEALGLVGSSGSGKSTLSMGILGLLGLKGGRVEGSIEFNGRDLRGLRDREMRAIRGKQIAVIPQSPLSALNPALTIGSQFREVWRAHAADRVGEWKDRVMDLLPRISLTATQRFLDLYPRQLSVGMAQRVLIAMAILHGPALLIADEATSALDAITRAEIIDLLAGLNRERGMGLLCISHDLGSVASLCSRIAILHDGEIVECDTTARIFGSPRHAYTQRLIAAIPRIS